MCTAPSNSSPRTRTWGHECWAKRRPNWWMRTQPRMAPKFQRIRRYYSSQLGCAFSANFPRDTQTHSRSLFPIYPSALMELYSKLQVTVGQVISKFDEKFNSSSWEWIVKVALLAARVIVWRGINGLNGSGWIKFRMKLRYGVWKYGRNDSLGIPRWTVCPTGLSANLKRLGATVFRTSLTRKRLCVCGLSGPFLISRVNFYCDLLEETYLWLTEADKGTSRARTHHLERNFEGL